MPFLGNPCQFTGNDLELFGECLKYRRGSITSKSDKTGGFNCDDDAFYFKFGVIFIRHPYFGRNINITNISQIKLIYHGEMSPRQIINGNLQIITTICPPAQALYLVDNLLTNPQRISNWYPFAFVWRYSTKVCPKPSEMKNKIF